MKYNYEFRFTQLENGNNVLTMDLPKEIELVSAFLHGIGSSGNWYIDGINAVLYDEQEYQEIDGEFYGLEIRKDFTRLHDVFGIGEECTIETVELKEIIEIWLSEYRNVKKNETE